MAGVGARGAWRQCLVPHALAAAWGCLAPRQRSGCLGEHKTARGDPGGCVCSAGWPRFPSRGSGMSVMDPKHTPRNSAFWLSDPQGSKMPMLQVYMCVYV